MMTGAMRWVVCTFTALLPAVGHGWGFDGHRRLARHMQDALPTNSCLRLWIAANQSFSFQNAAADPDRWRIQSHPNYDPDEWPRHYLEIDWASPIESYPHDWTEVEARFGQYAVKNGQVPWRSEEYYGRLVTAFRNGDTAAILTVLAHYSHYVTDAFSVLHDTKNFDPNGLHARWESDMLAVAANLDGITAAFPQYLGSVGRAHPRHHVFDIVIVGNGLLGQLLAADQAASASGTFDMPAFYSGVRELTARRWADALTLYGSLIASAWIDAGSPLLAGMPSGCSMQVPQGELVLRGYALPPPWQPPDAGSFADAGVPEDGGSGIGPANPPPPPEPADPSCGCTGAGGGIAWVALVLLARRPAHHGK
ncbi:MAG: hypothetical protein ACOZIN_11535 [Myxococcota bacterium]